MNLLEKIKGIAGKIVKFVNETQVETKKVIWPDRRYVIVATMLTLLIVIVLAVFLMGVDFAYTRLFQLLDKAI